MKKEIPLLENIRLEEAIDFLYEKIKVGGVIVAVFGEMGAGKTYFIRECLKKIGIDERKISSPTFTIAAQYDSNILHIDCYRLRDEKDFIDYGLLEFFYKGYKIFIEWPEKIENILNETKHFRTYITMKNNERKYKITLFNDY